MLSHKYNDGKLELEVEYSTGEIEFLDLDMVLDDDPLAVVHYILDSSLSRNKAEAKHARWARASLRGVQKTTRRLFIINNEIPSSISCRHVSKAGHMPPGKKRAKKKGVNNRIKGKTKYDVMVPRTYIQAVALDKKNGNTL